MKPGITRHKFFTVAVMLLASWMFFACNKPGDETPEPVDESCGVDNLITDLPWLKNLINNNSAYTIHEYAFIYSYEYKGKQVVHLWNSASSQNTRIVFKCDGTELISSTSTKEEWEEFENSKTEEELLWQKTPDPAASICGVANPLRDLPWIKKIMNNNNPDYRFGENSRIYAYTFRGKHVFYFWNPVLSYNPEVVFNCDGTILIPFSPCCEAWEEFMNDRKDEVLLWKNKF